MTPSARTSPPRRGFARGAGRLLAALVIAWHGAAPAQDGAAPREALLASAEAMLAQGDAATATRLFDQAAGLEHASDIELGLVRSYMQAGEYRRALAFAAHTAGAHGEEPGGTVLYAWLLRLGGQSAFAQRVLAQSAPRLAGAPLFADVRQAFAAPTPLPNAALLARPHRVAPYAHGDVVPTQARLLCSGLLVDAGRRALVPSAGLRGVHTLWLRDGLGRTTRAEVERELAELPLTVVRLAAPFETPHALQLVERDAFPGAPAYAIEYAATPDAAAAWPWLHQGFLGAPESGGALRRLGIELPAGPRGGPVFDLAGRLVGIALRDAQQHDLMLPATQLRRAAAAWWPTDASAAGSTRMPADAIYESALRSTLQVLAAP